jgi:3-hydroxyisobutyrate dehydrogenase-like beta-hydroxyacid dehydrogenase
MGNAIGAALAKGGHPILTTLSHRSPRTRELAKDSGFIDVPSIAELVRRADIVLSIVPPNAVEAVARAVLEAAKAAAQPTLFVDCNAVNPSKAIQLAEDFDVAGVPFVDGGIIGPPPGNSAMPRLYLSGPEAARAGALNIPGVSLRVLGPAIGEASALKLCFSAANKGLDALLGSALMAAHHYGLAEWLAAEFEESRPEIHLRLMKSMPTVASKAARFTDEMLEIASMFAEAGLSRGFHEGASDFYSLAAASDQSGENRDANNQDMPYLTTIEALFESLRRRAPKKAARS